MALFKWSVAIWTLIAWNTYKLWFRRVDPQVYLQCFHPFFFENHRLPTPALRFSHHLSFFDAFILSIRSHQVLSVSFESKLVRWKSTFVALALSKTTTSWFGILVVNTLGVFLNKHSREKQKVTETKTLNIATTNIIELICSFLIYNLIYMGKKCTRSGEKKRVIFFGISEISQKRQNLLW